MKSARRLMNKSADIYLVLTSIEDLLPLIHPDLIQRVLPETEVSHYQSLRPALLANEFLVGHLLARILLSQFNAKIHPSELKFEKNAFGKPFLVNRDLQVLPKFNISHSDGKVAIAVSLLSNVGVDIENTNRKVDMIDFARQTFSSEEVTQLEQIDLAQLKTHFFRLWTLKESFVKAIGEGLAFPLESFYFEFPIQFQEIKMKMKNDNLDHKDWKFLSLEEDNFTLSICYKGQKLSESSIVRISAIDLLADFQKADQKKKIA